MNSFSPNSIFEKRLVLKGEVIVRQGEYGDEAFLIQRGRVRVYAEKEQGGGMVELGTLEAGQIFGEMAITAEGFRTATVEALENCTLVIITRETLNAKLQKSDPTIRALTGMLVMRLQQGNAARLDKAGTIEELLNMVRYVYNNLHTSLSTEKRQKLDMIVRPKLEDLLAAIKAFQEQNRDA